ncbi:DNA damage-binding protein 1a [Abeliophyllum distichum]|uniref:DNA damage-binding protein 1a n=1 Tax=Abeliophyllum distichum TaxID=126358 RepID=A0ABD1PRZ9_9LAMI
MLFIFATSIALDTAPAATTATAIAATKQSFNMKFSIINSFVIAKEGGLTIGTIDDIQKLHIRSITLGEHARSICHQEQTQTFAICNLKILIFTVEDGKLQLIVEIETKGAVYSLNVFNEKLLTVINQKIRLSKWTLRDDGSSVLKSECGHHGHILALYVQIRGDFIIVGHMMKSI